MNKRAAYSLTACVTIFFTVFFLYPAVIVLKEAFYSSDDGFTFSFVREVLLWEFRVRSLLFLSHFLSH